jgi:hypothetical protein
LVGRATRVILALLSQIRAWRIPRFFCRPGSPVRPRQGVRHAGKVPLRMDHRIPKFTFLREKGLRLIPVVVAVGESVEMAVAVNKSLVFMGVLMDQVHPQEEVQVVQDLLR